MRELLLAFVKEVQARPYRGLHTLSRNIGDGERLSLSFGTGYFDPDKVLVWVGDDLLGEAETEEAVSAYCEGRRPEVRK